MFGARFGHLFDRPLEKVARFVPFHPDTITLIGFGVTVFASYVLATDMLIGGLLVLVGGAFDILDGVVARVNGKESRFGAFLDSVLDRYSDASVLIGIGLNLAGRNDKVGLFLALAAGVGSFMISYARARAEGLGESCKTGIMERPERLVLLSAGAISGFIIPVLWVLAVLTHFTALQRICHVRKMMR